MRAPSEKASETCMELRRKPEAQHTAEV